MYGKAIDLFRVEVKKMAQDHEKQEAEYRSLKDRLETVHASIVSLSVRMTEYEDVISYLQNKAPDPEDTTQ